MHWLKLKINLQSLALLLRMKCFNFSFTHRLKIEYTSKWHDFFCFDFSGSWVIGHIRIEIAHWKLFGVPNCHKNFQSKSKYIYFLYWKYYGCVKLSHSKFLYVFCIYFTWKRRGSTHTNFLWMGVFNLVFTMCKW